MADIATITVGTTVHYYRRDKSGAVVVKSGRVTEIQSPYEYHPEGVAYIVNGAPIGWSRRHLYVTREECLTAARAAIQSDIDRLTAIRDAIH